MIRITVKNDLTEKSYTFYKKEVLIGSLELEACDLKLSGARLKPEHLKIEEDKGRFILRNLANDPYATLNDLPFGKRILKNQDVIQIGKIVILFEGSVTLEANDFKEFPIVSTKEGLDKVVDQAIHKMESYTQENEPIFDEMQEYNLEGGYMEMNKEEVEALLEEWQEIESEFIEKTTLPQDTQQDIPVSPPPQKAPVILDLTDNDSEPLPFKQTSKPQDGNGPKSMRPHAHSPLLEEMRPRFKMIGAGLILALISIILIAGGVYWKSNQESEKKVKQVSRGVADIALAMTYAKIHHITPNQHNWSNPQFLKSSVAASLSPYHFSNLKLEGNGKIQEDYLLRIYTNRDNSRFIIIAQPEPSVFHYFRIPDSIVVDSSMMNISRVNDLKALNRLLIDPDQLHSPGKDEVAQIIKNSPIISMDSLADEFNTNGFKTPGGLKDKYPGAENYIYNSPRYSQVGEKIIGDAIDIAKNPSNGSEVRKIKDFLSSVAKLPNTVIYTIKGKERAQLANSALKQLSHEYNFLIAYIDYDQSTHSISSQIVDGDEGVKEENTSIDQNLISEQAAISYLSEGRSPKQSSNFTRDNHPGNPIYAKLNELSNKRKSELSIIQEELRSMIEKEIEEPGAFPVDIIRNKADTLALKIEELNITILKELHMLYGVHKDIPLAEFLEYVEKSGLRYLASNEIFPNSSSSVTMPCNFSEETNAAFNEIDKAENFEELFQAIDNSANYLSHDQSEDPQLIMAYQTQVKGRVIEKLNKFILSENENISDADFSVPNQEKLMVALKKAWISDTEEQDFYMSEFKLRTI